MPTASDLVTDLPADFETFGQAVATSMADLLGGTTGQVLAKASNTDMDFSWVAQDDSNAIQNAIVDAKGDLIAATAADTPARLAVGADYGFLQAIAAESTGLKWNATGWTSYTPVVAPITGSITSYSLTLAKWQRIGKTCIVKYAFTLTNAGTGSGLVFDIPFTATSDAVELNVGAGREYQTTGNMTQIKIDSGYSTTKAAINIYNNTQPCVTGYRHSGTIVYEVA
jgi:hypothetical protein